MGKGPYFYLDNKGPDQSVHLWSLSACKSSDIVQYTVFTLSIGTG